MLAFVGAADAQDAGLVEGPADHLVAFRMVERGVPRHDYDVVIDGEVRGVVTSGIYSPTLDAFVGMAYVPVDLASLGQEIGINIRGNTREAEVVKKPFYTPAYRR